jgi:polyribonucleotide nucleotidyltransferase
MNAGVAIEKPVAGIAMGLVTDGSRNVVLSDILGEEDHLGDMDFKVAGTEDGITAFQMDIKVKNVDPELMRTALAQAKQGRHHILGIMNDAISKPSDELSEYAPRIVAFKAEQDKIGLLIGPGGKTVRGISEKYDVDTNIEDDGTVTIYSKNKSNAEAARDSFMSLLEEPEVGKTYDGIVKRIVDFGAFIEFLPGKEGLCHISKMADHRINSVSDVLEMGQVVPVRIIEIDKMGRVNLSLIYEGAEDGSSPPSRGGGDRGRRGGGDRGGGDRRGRHGDNRSGR